jgi:hypothetical protein
MSRWDGVVATSVNRLVAARPHSAASVEAPRPGHHREALRDLGKDHDPSEDINQLRDPVPGRQSTYQPRPRRLRNPDQLRRGERYHRAVGELEM